MGGVLLSIVYGYDVKQMDDPFVNIAEETNDLGANSLLPDGPIVNTLPFCTRNTFGRLFASEHASTVSRLPPWMLGSRFAWLVNRVTFLQIEVKEAPWKWVKDEIVSVNFIQYLSFCSERSSGTIEERNREAVTRPRRTSGPSKRR
jgi:hypothetical protein